MRVNGNTRASSIKITQVGYNGYILFITNTIYLPLHGDVIVLVQNLGARVNTDSKCGIKTL